ncbi:hypothetical protein M2109_004914 [Paenibacillus sp. PastH-3]|nr:hypothetical protein [Paenibacillus sp. PastH-4]MDH6445971.1 hypothetical protein [Paenibacillus sp. PastF-4]MDH6530558.1 hypothetical protein [Paenibacillus sp. PastH-3]
MAGLVYFVAKERHMRGAVAVEGNKRRISIKTSGNKNNPDKERENKAFPEVNPEYLTADPRNPEDIPLEEKMNTMYRLTFEWAHILEKSRIYQYTDLLYSPWRLIWRNILFGAARGVGIALGFTFFAATIIYILQGLGALNLPIIGDYIADIVRIVQRQLEFK